MLFVVIIHVIVCAALITLVLIQRGRGGGLVESFSGVESMFGTKTDAFLTRATTVLSIAFFVTCLTLAALSIRQSRSLMRDTKVSEPAPQAAAAAQPLNQTTQATAPETQNAPAPVNEQKPLEAQ